MKVYFTNSSLHGCYYVRALLPLREAGWDGDKTSIGREAIPEEIRAKAVLDADVVVFHRPNDDRSLKIAKMLRSQGKRIVMDNDDTYKGFDMTVLGKMYPKIDQAIDEFGRFADLITCSTDILKEEYLKLNPNVKVIKNCVDPEDWPDTDEIERNENGKVRIGLVGSVGLLSDIDGFRKTLFKLKERKYVEIVVFALPPRNSNTIQHIQNVYREEYKFWDDLGIERHDFVHHKDYIAKLNSLKLDILAIPRKDDYFNHCKSNLKFLEASMLGVPCVAQGFNDKMSPYQVNPKDAEYIDIVVDNNDWMKFLDPLIESKELRRFKGRQAREYVIKEYGIESNIWRWEEVYGDLLNAQPTTHNRE